jgi:hypothetical protein
MKPTYAAPMSNCNDSVLTKIIPEPLFRFLVLGGGDGQATG